MMFIVLASGWPAPPKAQIAMMFACGATPSSCPWDAIAPAIAAVLCRERMAAHRERRNCETGYAGRQCSSADLHAAVEQARRPGRRKPDHLHRELHGLPKARRVLRR